MAFGLAFYALAVEALLLYVVAFGALWAPFGALICARVAKSNGLPVRDNAVRGLAYSLLLLLPWVYFVMRLSGKQIPASCMIASYALLYVCWFMLMFAKGIAISIDSSGPNGILAILYSALLVLSIIQWYFLPVVGKDSSSRKSIRYVYLSPFLYVSIVLFLQLGYNLVDRGMAAS